LRFVITHLMNPSYLIVSDSRLIYVRGLNLVGLINIASTNIFIDYATIQLQVSQPAGRRVSRHQQVAFSVSNPRYHLFVTHTLVAEIGEWYACARRAGAIDC
jgi:hypothetical protein